MGRGGMLVIAAAITNEMYCLCVDHSFSTLQKAAYRIRQDNSGKLCKNMPFSEYAGQATAN